MCLKKLSNHITGVNFKIIKDNGKIIILNFPSYSRVYDYVKENHQKIGIKNFDIDCIQLATKKDVLQFETQPKKVYKNIFPIWKHQRNYLEEYFNENGIKTFDDYLNQN